MRHPAIIVGAALAALLGLVASLSLPARAEAADLKLFYCYVPNQASSTIYVSDVHPVGPVAERASYGEEFARYLQRRGRVEAGTSGHCVMRATNGEIDRSRAILSRMESPCLGCQGLTQTKDVIWPRATRSIASGSGTGIADAFKVQNDAEWTKVSKGLPEPRDFPGHSFAFCYQPSSVDSVLYKTDVFPTDKLKTELELGFAGEVAKITRIDSAMSTHCYVSNDATYLDRLRSNVLKEHAAKKSETLFPPR